jgi:anti-anti-sigma factor
VDERFGESGIDSYMQDGVSIIAPKSSYFRGESRERDSMMNAFDAALASGASMIMLDLSHVNLISSSGLGFLLLISKKARRENVRLVVSGLSKDITEAFRISAMEKLFEIVPSIEDGLRLE